ncbi:hypothetical protein BT69DRAFT_1320811 [Atractiella rhizophila]|nr:hypothetical protein BT69DRAFT_1320811 [Atractiella rhizophila]
MSKVNRAGLGIFQFKGLFVGFGEKGDCWASAISYNNGRPHKGRHKGRDSRPSSALGHSPSLSQSAINGISAVEKDGKDVQLKDYQIGEVVGKGDFYKEGQLGLYHVCTCEKQCKKSDSLQCNYVCTSSSRVTAVVEVFRLERNPTSLQRQRKEISTIQSMGGAELRAVEPRKRTEETSSDSKEGETEEYDQEENLFDKECCGGGSVLRIKTVKRLLRNARNKTSSLAFI